MDLETNGLIIRQVSMYSISDTGHSLKALTDSLADWGLAHRARMMGQG